MIHTTDRFEPAIRLGHDERVQRTDPGQTRRVARGDRQADRLGVRSDADGDAGQE